MTKQPAITCLLRNRLRFLGIVGTGTACCVLLTWAFTCLPGGAAVPVSPASTNAADVYWDAYRTMTNGPAIPWEAMASNTLGEAESRALNERLQPVLDRFESASVMPFCDWQLDYSRGPGMEVPHLSPLRQLCRSAVWAAGQQAEEGSRRSTDLLLMALKTARRMADDPLLIAQLCAVAAENLCLDATARALGSFDPQDLVRLAAATPDPEAADRWQMSVQAEAECFAGWLIQKVMDAARSNALACAASSGGEAAGGTAAGGTNTLVRDLRLCALLDIPGSPLRIGLEMKDSNNIWLSVGQTRRGITLSSADFERAEAVITRGGESATIHLESGEIVPYAQQLTPAQIKQFFAMMGMDVPAGGEEGKSGRLSVIATRGILEELNKVREIETAWSQWRGWIPPEELERREKEAMGRLGDLGKSLLPALASAYEALFAGRVREQMLLAAIRRRLGADDAIAVTPDPTDGRPFDVRPCDDGGYELVSRATRRGQPVTLRIGPMRPLAFRQR